MAFRKYARSSDPKEENPTYECSKRRCKWQGKDSDKVRTKTDPEYPIFTHTCPKCRNDVFYRILNHTT